MIQRSCVPPYEDGSFLVQEEYGTKSAYTFATAVTMVHWIVFKEERAIRKIRAKVFVR